MISINVGGIDPVFGGDCISKFGIGCVQVDDTTTLATTKGVVVADAKDWKVQGKGGSFSN